MAAQLAFQKEVVEAADEVVHEVGRGAAVQLEGDAGVGGARALHGLGDKLHGLGLAGGDVHLTGDGMGGKGDLLLGLVSQSEDGLGVAAQDDALLGELDAFAVALIQKVPQLVFQSGQLARERRLGDVQ